jgi:hypothetical protein
MPQTRLVARQSGQLHHQRFAVSYTALTVACVVRLSNNPAPVPEECPRNCTTTARPTTTQGRGAWTEPAEDTRPPVYISPRRVTRCPPAAACIVLARHSPAQARPPGLHPLGHLCYNTVRWPGGSGDKPVGLAVSAHTPSRVLVERDFRRVTSTREGVRTTKRRGAPATPGRIFSRRYQPRSGACRERAGESNGHPVGNENCLPYQPRSGAGIVAHGGNRGTGGGSLRDPPGSRDGRPTFAKEW